MKTKLTLQEKLRDLRDEKKMTLAICFSLLLWLLSGCGSSLITSRLNQLNKETALAKESQLETSEQVLSCFSEKDIEGLKSLLCARTQNLIDIDEQITAAFDLFDGNVIAFDDHFLGYEGKSTEYGKTTNLERSWSINDIETDKNENYEIYINIYNIYENDKTREGITKITLTKDDDTELVIGYKWPSYYNDGRDLSSKVIAALSDNDLTSLKKQFCEKSLAALDIDEQLESALIFFEGNAIRGRIEGPDSRFYDGKYDYHTFVSDNEVIENYEPISTSISVRCENIMTDSDEIYEVVYYAYLLCRDNETIEGISQMIISRADGTQYIIGEKVE